MNRLDIARQIVRDYREDLAHCLYYQLDLKLTPIADEAGVRRGASKYRGLPHLPAGFRWPPGQFFAMQIDLAEFHRHDVLDVFPAEGLVSIFLSTATDDVTVFHHPGPADELVVTPYPEESTLPNANYHLADFRDTPQLVQFKPSGVFHVGGDAYDQSAALKALPSELVDRVAAALGVPIVGKSHDRNMFGRPLYWQGEDDDGGAGDDILLFQDDIDDVTVHVWLSADAAAVRNYAQVWLDGSGT